VTVRVVCDTNILVSAFIAAGPPSRIIEELIDGRFELILPRPVLVELKRILTEKLSFTPDRWREAEELLVGLARRIPSAPEGPAEAVTGDPADDLIFACAVEAGADVIVSGDRRHLLPVGEHRGVRVVTAQALLADLRKT